MRKHFPSFPQRNAEELYAAINVIKDPSLIRVESDEVKLLLTDRAAPIPANHVTNGRNAGQLGPSAHKKVLRPRWMTHALRLPTGYLRHARYPALRN